MSFNEFWLKQDRHTGRDAGIQRPWMANWLHSLVLYCSRSRAPAWECLPWRSSTAETYPTAGAVKTGLPRWSVGTRKMNVQLGREKDRLHARYIALYFQMTLTPCSGQSCCTVMSNDAMNACCSCQSVSSALMTSAFAFIATARNILSLLSI